MQESTNVKDSEKIISLLARMPMLKMFDRDQLGLMLRYTKIFVYDFGETIIEEGRTDKTIFILISGTTYVMKDGAHLGEFNSVGDIFGEISVIDGSVRSASIVAQEKTICLAIDASFIENNGTSEQTMLCQNILFRAFSELLANRLRGMNTENIRLRKELDELQGSRNVRSF